MAEKSIPRIKKERDSWGGPKSQEKLGKEFPMLAPPAVSMIHSILDRHGLVEPRPPVAMV